MKAFPIILAMAIAARSLHAQIVNDSGSRTLINETNTFTGDVTVGTNGAFTLLILSNNALLTNSGNGTIGLNATAKSNEVRLLSPSSRWFVGNRLMVGSNGAFNRLVVSNGATVRANSGELGLNVSASNNVAVVTGSGSVWSTAGITFGFNGAGNQLIVSNGGVLRANSSNAGVSSSSSNNAAIVTGSGSVWSNALGIQFGFNGAGNQLVISNGGVLRSSLGQVGSLVPSSNNLAVVTGSGSLWTNVTDLYVGHSGAGNRLVVSEGGAVRNGHGYVGGSAPGSNNLALITGAGSTWSNALDLNLGAFSSNNRMIVSNSATVFAANNGFIGTTANGNANSVTVTDPGTIWNNTFHTFVGVDGSDNHLVISNGGFVTNGLDGLIGVNSDAEANTVTLSGLGSRWVVSRFFELGRSGDDNELLIENGASLVSGKATIGVLSGSRGNQASVSGPGTTWTNLSSLEVGAAGTENTLAISDGACVVSSNVTIGALASASRNAAGMFDPASRWLMEGDLCVGSNGPSSVLFLNGGGTVVNANGIIGYGSTSSSNRAILVGAGAVWSNRESLYIGRSGRGNQLVVSSGAMVWTPFTSMGFEASSSNNSALVIGTGSLWTNVAELFIGDSGPGNQVVVSNGGFVRNDYVAIGFNESSSNNSVLVADGGSLCSSATALDVGRMGSRNQLVVSDGATVTGGASVILGVRSNSLNNRVVVDGGTLHVSNALGNAVLDIRRGTNVLNAGLIDVQRLLLTNALGFFEFNGGKFSVGNSTVNNGQLFRVGNGVSPATLALTGNGTHSFANGLAISANAMLTGNGNVSGILSVQTSGTLAPGASVGKMVLSNSPSLQGAVVMEISKNPGPPGLTNDQIQVTGTLTYGGSLTVTNFGPTALAAGDRFQLFSAPSFAGIFSALSLPPLGTGLDWTNKLLLDGSIEVVTRTGLRFGNVTRSGTNLILSITGGSAGGAYNVLSATNIVTPLTNWITLSSGTFDSFGNATVTNGIALAEPKRYFRIRAP